MILSENRVFVDVIRKEESSWIKVVPIPSDQCPCRTGGDTQRFIYGEESHVETGVDCGLRQPQVLEHHVLLRATGTSEASREDPSLDPPKWAWLYQLLDLRLVTSRINFCHSKPPSLWQFVKTWDLVHYSNKFMEICVGGTIITSFLN